MVDQFTRENREHRALLLEIILKCADISNPTRPPRIAAYWSQMVQEEFFAQVPRSIHLKLRPFLFFLLFLWCCRRTLTPRFRANVVDHTHAHRETRRRRKACPCRPSWTGITACPARWWSVSLTSSSRPSTLPSYVPAAEGRLRLRRNSADGFGAYDAVNRSSCCPA